MSEFWKPALQTIVQSKETSAQAKGKALFAFFTTREGPVRDNVDGRGSGNKERRTHLGRYQKCTSPDWRDSTWEDPNVPIVLLAESIGGM
jgi:hypothetical protein